jgi:hypothetical protein
MAEESPVEEVQELYDAEEVFVDDSNSQMKQEYVEVQPVSVDTTNRYTQPQPSSQISAIYEE